MVRRVLSLWCFAAALVATACDLNPRPEDPGVNSSDRGAMNAGNGKTGTGGSASVPPPPFGSAGAAQVPSGGPPTPAADAGARPPIVTDASASDAGHDGGDAGASTHDGALN